MESKLPEEIESQRLIIRVARPSDGAMLMRRLLNRWSGCRLGWGG